MEKNSFFARVPYLPFHNYYCRVFNLIDKLCHQYSCFVGALCKSTIMYSVFTSFRYSSSSRPTVWKRIVNSPRSLAVVFLPRDCVVSRVHVWPLVAGCATNATSSSTCSTRTSGCRSSAPQRAPPSTGSRRSSPSSSGSTTCRGRRPAARPWPSTRARRRWPSCGATSPPSIASTTSGLWRWRSSRPWWAERELVRGDGARYAVWLNCERYLVSKF